MNVSVAARLDDVSSRIRRACERAGRAHEGVTLVAISKGQSIQLMNEYAAAARDRKMKVVFGENYLQEYRSKESGLVGVDEVHMTGPLQSNKVRDAVGRFAVIETVQSEKILRLIAKESERRGLVQKIFLQVNISGDPSKSGFSPEDIHSAVQLADELHASVRLEGLMTITAYYDDPEDARPEFRRMHALAESVRSSAPGRDSIEISMGMSADFEIAVEEGASLVRVGTALFGER